MTAKEDCSRGLHAERATGCKDCSWAYGRKRRDDKKAAGRCARCSAHTLPGLTLCETHLETQRVSVEARRERYRAEGRCIICGKYPGLDPDPGWTVYPSGCCNRCYGRKLLNDELRSRRASMANKREQMELLLASLRGDVEEREI